jgi:hypothetical protein
MTETEELWLVVAPAGAADERLETLLPALARLGIDAYQARARLVGSGPALLGRGAAGQLEKAAALLQQYQFAHWIVPPPRPRFAPMRLLAVESSRQQLTFVGQGASLILRRGGRILAVVADLSGAVVRKNLQRLLAQNAYLGSASHLPEEELLQTIFTASPVLDLYLLSEPGEVEGVVRALPGRFNPAGLRERATLSAAGNLRALLEAVREMAPAAVVNGEFGLASIPGCQPKLGEGDVSPRPSLAALDRYGWLLASMVALRPAVTAEANPLGVQVANLPGGAILGLATAVGMTDTAALAGLAEALPPSGAASAAPQPTLRPAAAPVPEPLPLPPDIAEEGSGVLLWLRWSSLGFGVMAVPMILNHHLGFLAFRYGLLPALFALVCFIGAFQVLRWKRRIENTPTSRVRSMAMGVVEVHGRARRKYALVSPMTQMACVWYRLFRYRRGNKGWQLTSVTSSGSVPFWLDDGTGRVLIEPRGAMVRPRTRQEGYGAGASGLLAISGASRANEKWVEEVVYEGTSLYVLGNAHPVQRKCNLRERTMEALRRLKGDPEAMRRYDLDGNGQICQKEWDLARTDVEAQILRESLLDGRQQRPRPEVAIGKQGAAPLIIAETESEARLARGYGWTAFGLLTLGLLLAVAAAVLLYRA